MSQEQQTPEQLACQLFEGMAALIQNDLQLKAVQQSIDESKALIQDNSQLRAAQQRGDELLRNFKAQMEAERRIERRALFTLFAIAIMGGGVAHLVYPDWLPEQLASILSFVRQL